MGVNEKKIVRVDKAYVCSQAGENASSSIPASKTIINDGKTYYVHPIYNNYAGSEDGYIINRKRLIPRKGRLNLTGYLETTVRSDDCKIKIYKSHRFIWESINQQIIPDGYQIHHINNDKQDNSINNLKLVTRQQNMIYKGNECKGKTISKKQNVEIKCNMFYYHNIYTNYGVNKFGQIYNKKNKRCSIGNLLPSDYMGITLTQIGLPKKHF